jgi:hypothetical protein
VNPEPIFNLAIAFGLLIASVNMPKYSDEYYEYEEAANIVYNDMLKLAYAYEIVEFTDEDYNKYAGNIGGLLYQWNKNGPYSSTPSISDAKNWPIPHKHLVELEKMSKTGVDSMSALNILFPRRYQLEYSRCVSIHWDIIYLEQALNPNLHILDRRESLLYLRNTFSPEQYSLGYVPPAIPPEFLPYAE